MKPLDGTKDPADRLRSRRVLFLLLGGGIALLFLGPLRLLFQTARSSELYSHIPLVPLVTVCLLFMDRNTIFGPNTDIRSCSLGILPLMFGIALAIIGRGWQEQLTQNDYLSLEVFGAFLCLNGAFLWLFGADVFRRASFPLLFLVFLIPVPDFLMKRIIVFLQSLSTETVNIMYKAIGIPFYRDGFDFSIYGLDFQIAESCSGIRSSIALFITAVLAGHLFLKTGLRKAALLASVIPITVFKNGARILLITLSGAYVDPRILDGQLHRAGGIPFFFAALTLLGAVLWLLRRSERNAAQVMHAEN